MDYSIGPSTIYFNFLSEEQRQQMIENTKFVCLYQEYSVRFDPLDGDFWAFQPHQKFKLKIADVRKMPEVKLFKINLNKFKK